RKAGGGDVKKLLDIRLVVVGMDQILPLLLGDLLWRNSEKRQVGIVDELSVALSVRHPDDEWSVFRQLAETLLAMAHRHFRLAPEAGHLQMRPDARQQFTGAERLDQIIVGASFHPLDARLLTGARRK